MKPRTKPPVGLIWAGRLTDWSLARWWRLKNCLGPVKSPTLRVASRITNTMRAGYPVADYQAFESCSLIFISVPDKQVEKIIGELSAVSLAWKTKAVILCSQSLDSSKLEALAKAEASVGSIAAIPGFEDRWFLLESEKPVGVSIRQFLDPRRNTRMTVIRPGLKPLYLAALACAGRLFQPMLVAGSEALDKAGIPARQAAAILEKQVERSMRFHFKTGRKALPADRGLSGLIEAVEKHDRQLARYLEESSRAANDMLMKGPQ